jgi:hypothetical protein
MDKTIFETDNAIFSFALPDVLNLLSSYSSEHQVEEATDLLEKLKSMPNDLREVPRENGFFGYVVLDLLDKGKGSIFCKSCQKKYPAKLLQSTSIGFGKNPLTVNLKKEGGVIKRLFGKRIRIGMMGGESYLCPEEHELISMITWIS